MPKNDSSDLRNKAGMKSLPSYLQNAVSGSYLDLAPRETSAVVYGRVKPYNTDTDSVISSTASIRDTINDIFFKNSTSAKSMENAFSQADDISQRIALKHYSSSMGNSNVGLALHNLDKFNSMVSKGTGSILAMDTETFGTKGTAEFPGITELGYFKRDASTIKNSANMKALFQGEYDKANSRKSFLFGLTDPEYNSIKGTINKVRNGSSMTQAESITLGRMALYSDADIQWSANQDRFTLNKIGSKVDEFAPRNNILERAELGLNRLSGKTSGLEGMKNQTVRSNKAHGFIFDWLRQANDKDNLNVIFNNGFDAPFMNNIIKDASPYMSESMKAQFMAHGGGINPNNIFDPLEVLNAAHGEKSSSLYTDVFEMAPMTNDRGLMTLDNISETAKAKVRKDFKLGLDELGSIHHQADYDAQDTMNLLSYRKDGKLIFSDMGEKIKHNLKNAISEEAPNMTQGKTLAKGDLMYFMTGSGNGPLDGLSYNNASLGKTVIDKSKTGPNAIGSKEVLKFDGLYKGNVKSIMKNISEEQQKALLNAINSGAVKDNFSVAVLKNAYNQSVMLYGTSDWDIAKKLQPGFVIGQALGNDSFSKGNIAIDRNAMKVLGASESDIRLRAQGMIGDIDKAQKRYSSWFSASEEGRSISQAKNFYSTASELKGKGVTKDEFFSIAFEGKTIKGVDSKSISDKLSRYEYGAKVGYTTSGPRDMYHMYNRLGAESDIFLPAIDKIEKTFGNLDGIENNTRAKAVMSELHGLYSSQLEAAGISPTVAVGKLGYEKNAVIIPKNLFSTDDVSEAIEKVRRGGNIEELGIELNLGSINQSSSTIKKMVAQAQKDIGATHDTKFESNAVGRLADYLTKTGVITVEQSKNILDTNSSSAWVKAQDILSNAKSNRTHGTTLKDTFELMDDSLSTSNKISSVLANGGSKAIAGVTDDVISNVSKNLHVVNPYSQSGLKSEIADKLMSSSWAQDIISGGATSDLYNSKEMATKSVDALSESIERIASKVKSQGKEFHFAIQKTQGKKYSTYDLVFGKTKGILDSKSLDGAANVGRVELGTVLNYQGVPVIMKGGYKQIAATHLDTYDAFKGGFQSSKMKVYDSYSYGMKSIGINAESISDAFVNGDMDTASSRMNRKINKVYSDLKRLDSNIYDKADSLRAGDMGYSMKMYTDDTFKILGHESMKGIKDLKPGETQLETLNSYITGSLNKQGGAKSLASKIKNTKASLDLDNMAQALKIMMKDSDGKSVSPIAQEIAKWATATGVPEEQVMNLMFAVHEGDANKAMSAWGAHPSEFHPFGSMYSQKRPVGRQVLAGKSFFTKTSQAIIDASGNTDLEIGFPIETKITNTFRSTIEKHTGRSADRVLTGNALFMSQETFDSSLSSAVSKELSTTVSAEGKAKIRSMYDNMRRLSVNNGESIIAHEVGEIFSDAETKEYRTGSTFQLHKSVSDKLSGGDYADVIKKDVIGYEKNSSGVLKEVIASGTGKLEAAEDGRYLLHYNDKTNPVMKIGMNAMDKSVGMIANKDETNFLRKHFGNFSVISNNEIGKHEGFNMVYNDLFSKRYQEIKNSSMSMADKNAQFAGLQEDMNSSLMSKNAATLAKDGSGNVTGINLMAHDFEHEASATKGSKEQLSKDRMSALTSIREKYSSGGKENYYDITRTLEGGGKANVYKTTLSGMQLMDDTILDKGVKYDTRVMESLLRQTDSDGDSLMKNFVGDLYKQQDGKFTGGLLKGSELERLNRSHYDVKNMSKFLNMYGNGGKVNESSLGNVKELNSVLDMPFYKKSYGYNTHVDWDELQSHMTKHGKMFGDDANFVKIKLNRDIKLQSNGETIRELLLPNVNMASMGETSFKSTNYQKSLSGLINATVDLKNSSLPLVQQKKSALEIEKQFESSVNKIYDSIKTDFGAKDGILGGMFNARLEHSGTALNKELYQAAGQFTAGAKGNEDIVYMSQEYAERLLKGDYNKYEHLLKRDLAAKAGGAVEDTWGMTGITLRYPAIQERSPSVSRFRIAEGAMGERILGGRQVSQFRHTSWGANADVDGDQLGITLLDPSKLSKGAISDLDRTYKHQMKQNDIAKMFIKDEYKTTNGLNKNNNGVLNWNQMMKSFGKDADDLHNPFVSRLDNEGVQGIYEAFKSKADVGTANIPSFYLRQHGREALNNGAIGANDLKLVSAFSESAENKMIDAIKKSAINEGSKPIDMYFQAMQHHDTEKLLDLVNMPKMRDAIESDVVKRYAYSTANMDLAQQVIDGDKGAISKKYNELSSVLRKVMDSSSYKTSSMEMAVAGNLSEAAMKQAINNNIVSIKGSAQDIIAGNLGFERTYNAAKISTGALTNQLQKHSNSGIIGETAETATEYFKNAMTSAGEKGASAVNSATEFLKSSKAKNIGIALAAISIGAMALGSVTKPNVNTRQPDDVGLTEDEAGPVPHEQMSSPASIIMGNKPLNGNGMQINISASNKSRNSQKEMQSMIRNSFGGDLNIKMNVNDDTSNMSPNYINNLMMNSLG